MNIIETDYLEDLSKKDVVELSQRIYLNRKELKVEEVSKGIVLPPQKLKTKILNKLGSNGPIFGNGGVTDEFGNYIKISAQDAQGMRARVKGAYHIKNKEIPFVDEEVIYMNFYIHQWGHFLLDVVGRLWYALINTNLKIVFTCYEGENDNISGNYLEFLELLGIDKSRLVLINQVTKFAKVIIPESSIVPGAYYTKEYKNLFNLVVENSGCAFNDNQSIYCSRSKLQNAKWKEFGEDSIESIFVNSGFEPVYMEQHTLSEQISILNNSKEIVLTSGSLAHNLLFLKKKARVTILNKTYRVNLHQFLINDISDGLITFVDMYISPMPILYGLGPFMVTVTEPLKNFLVDRGIKLREDLNISKIDYFSYYLKWLRLYKAYIFRINSIREGNNEFEKDFFTIRKYFKARERK